MQAEEVNLYVYNTSLQLVAIIDRYSSLIWADRYDECGDFEIVIPYEEGWNSIFQKDYYCHTNTSDHWCIIEKLEPKNDYENAPEIIISGRSVECILERRVVITKVEFGDDDNDANVQDSIQSLLNTNIINPENANRKISNFVFVRNNDPEITSLTFKESYDGDDLLNIITGICQDKHIGFRIYINSSNQFEFYLYKGTDRSQSTNTTNYVIFSPYFDNLLNSDFFTSNEEYRNLMIISKEDDEFLSAYLSSQEPSGVSRREVQVGQSEFKDNKDSSDLTDAQLIEKAKKKLTQEYKVKTGFEGEIVPEQMYKYRTDYNTGDKVHFQDDYGNSETVYISEVVISVDENGLTILPTFEEIDWYE